MRITKIKMQNFRLLKDISVDLESGLSVIIGKNNTGKTSFLLCLEKFIGGTAPRNTFTFEDLNSDVKDNLLKIVSGTALNESSIGIVLKVFIEYDDDDDLENIGDKVIMDLDPDNKVVVLAFEYKATTDDIATLVEDFKELTAKKNAEKKSLPSLFEYLRDKHNKYFTISRRSLYFDMQTKKEDDEHFVDLDLENINLSKIINFKWISARRNVSNKDADNSLSQLSAKIYKKLEASNPNESVVEEFKDTLTNTDAKLNIVYQKIFEGVINDVKKFGGLSQNDSVIKIVSSLQHRDLLEENTTVMYGLGNNEHDLPENYNGLGYLNLISMIFEIKLKLHDFHKDINESPSDINLLFIEEPEAHTHPQLQRIFIKNIKSLLKPGIKRVDGVKRDLQTILSTHSSYIVSESDFEDIKYFKKTDKGVTSKNLKDLKDYYEDSQHYTFLKQYLTIHRSELFFADKAVFIEGDTERVLLPAMMSKVDQEDLIKELETGVVNNIPLLSQNISMIEVGAYSHIFEKFVNFIGVRSLIITDIDASAMMPVIDKATGQPKLNKKAEVQLRLQKCKVEHGTHTTNASLRFFYKKEDLAFYQNLDSSQKTLEKMDDAQWSPSILGKLLCAYQVTEKNMEGEVYHATSFEDAFFHINRVFIKSLAFDEGDFFIGDKKLPSLVQVHLKSFASGDTDAFDCAENAITSKPSFAMEILLNSTIKTVSVLNANTAKLENVSIDFSNWNTPLYIKEALQWLKQG
ncbi:DNA replication and repair protein RecF [Pseudomonas syringae pv. actinidiae]|uniref:AAA family ATPase n=1 Tax=Pseudomonas syringae TaxID=317 RepID=UPI000A236A8A|nr:ATP-dependent endonuclease [Pseudomonas syringae]OSR64818.1 DNA replication and repair protein RecF [Pseudomonas syringae pv. actinidiae]